MASEMPLKRALKPFGGLANEKGRAHIFVKRIQPRQTFILGAPTDNPVNIVIGRQRVAGRLGICRFAVCKRANRDSEHM